MSGRSKGAAKAVVVAMIALALDQITKAIARSQIAVGEQVDFMLGIEFVRVGNDGIAFGLLDEAGPAVIVIAAAAFVLLLAYFAQTSDRRGLWLPIGLLAGGALGNLTDRVLDGRVTDFIDPPNWPAFNVADVEITIGVILLIFLYLKDPDGETGGEVEPVAGREGT